MNKQEKTALTAVGILGGIALLYVLHKRTEAAPPNGNGNGNGNGTTYDVIGHVEEYPSGNRISAAKVYTSWQTVYSAADGTYQLTGFPYYTDVTIWAEKEGYYTDSIKIWRSTLATGTPYITFRLQPI